MNTQKSKTNLGVELPDNFENFSDIEQQMIISYLKQLDKIEKQAYMIGKAHLGTSFNIIKSNGFNDWKKKSSFS